MIVSLFIIGGIQLFALGMIGEYLGRLFLKDNGRPQFVVREQINCEPEPRQGNVMSLATHFTAATCWSPAAWAFSAATWRSSWCATAPTSRMLDSLIPQFGGSFFNISPIRDQVVVNISDMRDANSLDILVQGKDYIFNLAGQVSHGDSMRDPQLDLGVNCVSTMNLVEACRKHNPERAAAVHLDAASLWPTAKAARDAKTIPPCRSTSTASTSWPPSITTCSITAPTAFARPCCG